MPLSIEAALQVGATAIDDSNDRLAAIVDNKGSTKLSAGEMTKAVAEESIRGSVAMSQIQKVKKDSEKTEGLTR